MTRDTVRYTKTSDGVSVAFLEEGVGIPIIVIPNMPLSHLARIARLEEYLGVRRELLKAGRVTMYDNRGSGLSDRQPADYSIEGHLRDLDAVVEALDVDKFALLGRTNGSPVAIAYAARHPERLSHLLLWRGFAWGKRFYDTPLLQSFRDLRQRDWTLYTETIAHALRGWSKPEVAREAAQFVRDAVTQETANAIHEQVAAFDVRELLGQVNVPTLVMQESDNPYGGVETAKEIASGIPGAELLILPGGGGGAPNEEQLAALSLAVRQFIGADESNETFAAVSDLDAQLTPRETEILRLIAAGRTSSEISGELSLSIRTVGRHITNIYNKIGARGRADAASYALRHHISRQ